MLEQVFYEYFKALKAVSYTHLDVYKRQREEYTHFLLGKDSENVKCIEFVSLQDMKGSIYFGGQYLSLIHIYLQEEQRVSLSMRWNAELSCLELRKSQYIVSDTVMPVSYTHLTWSKQQDMSIHEQRIVLRILEACQAELKGVKLKDYAGTKRKIGRAHV